MAKAIALARTHVPVPTVEIARALIVSGCALALILVVALVPLGIAQAGDVKKEEKAHPTEAEMAKVKKELWSQVKSGEITEEQAKERWGAYVRRVKESHGKHKRAHHARHTFKSSGNSATTTGASICPVIFCSAVLIAVRDRSDSCSNRIVLSLRKEVPFGCVASSR